MDGLQIFNVAPAIPEKLRFLDELSRNLWWSVSFDAIELFRRIDRDLWKNCKHNPVAFLNRLSQGRLEEMSVDVSFLSHLERVRKGYDASVLHPAEGRSPIYREKDVVAYFSAEFGIHESIPIYAGGLGLLAGDHLKAASNMGVPLVAVGLLYRHGYFRQYLNDDGWQQERLVNNEVQNLPLARTLGADGKPLSVSVPLPAGEMHAAVWKINVGRIPLFLLDTNVTENTPALRDVTSQLYGGDQGTRLLQELLLGLGGMRALEAMGIVPSACHMNEGHSAFISLERLAYMINVLKLDKKTALEIIPRTNVFTTHTSVPAGHDVFPPDMVAPYFRALEGRIQSKVEEILSWGRPVGAPENHGFSMTVFALRMAQNCNGVSRLHGGVARRMAAHLWPRRPEADIPIKHITNGVHTPSWISPENAILFDRYLGPLWLIRPGDAGMGPQIDNIPDEELWRAHELSRSRLIRECRELLVRQGMNRNAGQQEQELVRTLLDPDILTIGFARRFATYKRANLLFSDSERFAKLLSDADCPVQIIFAGKSHPHDNPGKELIKQIVHTARNPNLRRRIVFIEDYDIDIARTLVQGVDIWLNTPRRPMEASGTSGMKAAVNGAINLSVLDGWWCEGYDPSCGWSIGKGEEYRDAAYQDYIESHALYNILENEVVPRFYDRPNDHIPTEWVKMMKQSMKMAFTRFSSHRMVREYEERFYIPAIERGRELVADNFGEAHSLAAQHERLAKHWKNVTLEKPEAHSDLAALQVGDFFKVSVRAHLGELKPDEVVVELYFGLLNALNEITDGQCQQMLMTEAPGKNEYVFECRVDCGKTGRYGFTARVIPSGDEWTQHLPGYMVWARHGEIR